MPLTPDNETETVEDAIDDVGSAIREQIEEVIIAQPIKSLAIALIAGVVIGRFVL